MQDSNQLLQLVDAKRRNIGKVKIDNQEDHLLTGEFVPGPNFSLVKEIFQKFEDAVNVQALSIVDQLDQEIAAFGLQLYVPDHGQSIKIHDVQIWRDGGFSCQLTSEFLPPTNGLPHATQKSTFTTVAH